MYLVVFIVLMTSHRAQQHLTYPIIYCNMASTCIHDNHMVCASTVDGCSRRTFLDQCDMYEYNCDFGTRFQETYRLLCAAGNTATMEAPPIQITTTGDISSELEYTDSTTAVYSSPVTEILTTLPEPQTLEPSTYHILTEPTDIITASQIFTEPITDITTASQISTEPTTGIITASQISTEPTTGIITSSQISTESTPDIITTSEILKKPTTDVITTFDVCNHTSEIMKTTEGITKILLIVPTIPDEENFIESDKSNESVSYTESEAVTSTQEQRVTTNIPTEKNVSISVTEPFTTERITIPITTNFTTSSTLSTKPINSDVNSTLTVKNISEKFISAPTTFNSVTESYENQTSPHTATTICCNRPETWETTKAVETPTHTTKVTSTFKTTLKKTTYENHIDADSEVNKRHALKSKGTVIIKPLKGPESTWWYPTPCRSSDCQRPITWETTKSRKKYHGT